MHELGLCAAIVDAVERRAGERPVARLRVRVGQLHHVHPDAFRQSFEMAAAGTVVEDAVPDLVLLPVRGHCRSCDEEFEAEGAIMVCPGCGGLSLDQTGGDELVLESIEYRS